MDSELHTLGTEALIRVMVEARDMGQVQRLTQFLVDTVQRAAEEAA